MPFRRIFTDKEHAMQEKKSLGFTHIYTKDGQYYYKSQAESDSFYTGMESYILTEETPETLVKEQPDHCKIYRYIPTPNNNLDVAPIDYNYNVGLITTLFPKRTFVHGELQKVEWYSNDSFNDLVIQVDIVYTRDAVGFATSRTTTRTWYREDGTAASPTKVTEKLYTSDFIAQIEEGQRRRGNIIKGLQIPMVGLLLATIAAKPGETEEERSARIILLGRKFLNTNKSVFTNFIEDSNREIVEVVQEATDFWLDNIIDENGTTIRQYVLAQLDIGGIS